MFKLYFWVHCNQGHADTLTILIPTNLSLPGRGDKESSEEDTSEHEEITEEEGLPAPGTVIVTTSVSAAEPVEAPAPADTVTESKKDDEKKRRPKKKARTEIGTVAAEGPGPGPGSDEIGGTDAVKGQLSLTPRLQCQQCQVSGCSQRALTVRIRGNRAQSAGSVSHLVLMPWPSTRLPHNTAWNGKKKNRRTK